MKEEKKATWLAMIGNTILFLAKIVIGVMYNSIAIISDAINSFTDIIASLIVHISVIISYQKPDKEHQFGHNRAQPIAGLIVAIFIGIVGFEIISASITRIITGEEIERGIIPLLLMVIVMITKFIMYLYTAKIIRKTNSTALKASAIDHRNDVLIGLTVFIGLLLANLGYAIFDPIVAVMIGLWVIKAGYDVGIENIKYLMGERPGKELFEKIEARAKSVKEVLGLNDVRAHYVGTHVEVEIHIYVDKKMNIQKAHDIGKRVQNKIEKMEEISRAFIHIDPFLGNYYRRRKF